MQSKKETNRINTQNTNGDSSVETRQCLVSTNANANSNSNDDLISPVGADLCVCPSLHSNGDSSVETRQCLVSTNANSNANTNDDLISPGGADLCVCPSLHSNDDSSLLQNIYTGNFIFETLNIENGLIKRDKFHLNRILFSIDKLKWFKTIDNYNIEEWWNLFLLNRITNIKHQTRGKLILIPDKSTIIPQFEIFEFPKYKEVCNLTLNHEFIRHSKDFFWQIKTGSYSRNIYYSKNKPENIDDFIFYNEKNNICETIFSNIYLKINNQIITPKAESGVLKGTFREYLLNEKYIKINNNKYQIIEETINISDLNENSELFISNSLSELRKAIFIK